MKSLLNILGKIFVTEFYKRNAGFFSFLIIMLVLLQGNPILFHRELITSIVLSKTELIVALLVFALYYLKCLLFIIQRIKNKSYGFISEMQSYQLFRKIAAFAFVFFLISLPFTVYEIFIIDFGLRLKHENVSIIVVLFIIITNTLSVFICCITLKNGYTKKVRNPYPLRLPTMRKRFLLMQVYYLFNKGKWRFLVVKFCSFLLLAIMCVWNRNDYEFSDFLMFFEFSIAAHSLLMFDCVEFLETNFSVRRNLPMPVYTVFAGYLLFCCLVVLPECLTMLYFGIGTDNPTNVFVMMLLYVAELLLFTAICYEKGIEKQYYFGYVALLTIAFLFLSMLKIFFVIALAALVISYSLFQNLFYGYEADFKNGSPEIQ